MNDDISNEIYNELDDIIKCYLLKLSIFYEKNIDIDMRKLHRMINSINNYLIKCVENSTNNLQLYKLYMLDVFYGV